MRQRRYRSNQGRNPVKERASLKIAAYSIIGILITIIIYYAYT